VTRREKREEETGDPRFTAGDRGRGGSGTARTLSAMVLRTSSVLILESATALTETERLSASCGVAGWRRGQRRARGGEEVGRRSRRRFATRGRMIARRVRSRSRLGGRPRPRSPPRHAPRVSRPLVRVARAGPRRVRGHPRRARGAFRRAVLPRILKKYRGKEKRDRGAMPLSSGPGSGRRTLGCATFTPLKVVARRARVARALGATARGARTATGATMAAMVAGA
jgi:hypothetical protein